LDIPKTVVLRILKEELGKRKLCARFVPHCLTPEQSEDQVTSCQDIIAMADADKSFFNKICKCVPIFDPPECYNPLSSSVLSRFISATLFSVPPVENAVNWLHFADVAEIQVAVTDELKKVQTEEFLARFRNRTIAQKTVYMTMELILNTER